MTPTLPVSVHAHSYAGAAARFGYDRLARVGIHQPYFQVPSQKINADTVRKDYNTMLQDIRAYLREMNVSERLADEKYENTARRASGT